MMQLTTLLLRSYILITSFTSIAAASVDMSPDGIWSGVLATLLYGLIGVIMASIGFKVVDLLTPGRLSHDIAEGKNMPLSLLASSMILGICIIIAAAISG